jgi:hypothetical protein
MVRPLRLDGTSAIRQMSDNDLDRLCYNLAVAYSDVVNTPGYGTVRVGSASGYTSIGSASDTFFSDGQNSAARTLQASDDTDPDGGGPVAPGDWPAVPGTSENISSTTTYYQDQRQPSYPSTGTLDADSYLYWTGSALRVAGSTESQIYDEVVAQAIADMKTGNAVGTYYVSTSSPNYLGAGTWTDKGTFFSDTTHDQGTTTYKLWLKRSLTSVPGTDYDPVKWNTSSSAVQEITNAKSGNLIQNILLPVLQRRIDNNDLVYSVSQTLSHTNRGAFTNTAQTGSTTSYVFSDPTYFTNSSVSGAASTRQTHYFQLD